MNTESENEAIQTLHAPWNRLQIDSLNGWQECPFYHPFTCGTDNCPGVLTATRKGWKCSFCDYTQDWCFTFMADWSWKKIYERHKQWLEEFNKNDG